MTVLKSLAAHVARESPSAGWGISAAAALRLAGRTCLLVGALWALDNSRAAAVAFACGALLPAVESAILGLYGSRARRALISAAFRQLMLRVVPGPTSRPIGESVLVTSVFESVRVVVDAVPSLLGDGLALALGIGLCIRYGEPRIALLLLTLSVVAGLGLGLVSRRLRALHESAESAFDGMATELSLAMHAAPEMVANGREGTLGRRFSHALQSWSHTALHTELVLGVVGRMGLLLAILVAALGSAGTDLRRVGLDTPTVYLFFACIPSILGVLRGAHLFVTLPPRASRLLDLLDSVDAHADASTRDEARQPIAHEGPALAVGPLRAVRIEGLGHRYPGATEHAFRGLDAVLSVGEVSWLVGPNGSGKSTLLRLLWGAMTASEGRLHRVKDDSAGERALGGRRPSAFIPESPYFPPGSTVGQYLLLYVDTLDAPRTRAALERVGLAAMLSSRSPEDMLDVSTDVLSAGQKKRLALARLLLQDADLVLLDEPDSDLDASGAAMLASILDQLRQDRLVVVASHGPDLCPGHSRTLDFGYQPPRTTAPASPACETL